ncbi:unnamed protein product [Choristocarpus tenellus]
MGTSGSTCKGTVNPAESARDLTGGGDEGVRGEKRQRVYQQPIPLPKFVERDPFISPISLCERDVSLLKAVTHHRTPFAVVDLSSNDLNIIYVSGGFVAAMGMDAEAMIGKGLEVVLAKGIKAKPNDVAQLTGPLRAHEVS